MTQASLVANLIQHWQQLRSMTYDLLDAVQDSDLEKTLPFPTSKSLGYQFWCMTGAQESFLPLIEEGVWRGFSCSLDSLPRIDRQIFRDHMQQADERLFVVLRRVDLLAPHGEAAALNPMAHYLRLVEHESHHQGQMINFIYAFTLPIPQSWADRWALSH